MRKARLLLFFLPFIANAQRIGIQHNLKTENLLSNVRSVTESRKNTHVAADSNERTIRNFDETGNLVRITRYEQGRQIQAIAYTYDKSGFISDETTVWYAKDTTAHTVRFVYNTDHRLIRQLYGPA